MGLTKAQIRTAVISNTNRIDKLSLIDIAIDLACQEISGRHSWKGLRTEEEAAIAEGDSSFPLPEGTLRVVDVRIGDGSGNLTYPLCVTPKKVLTRQYPNLQTTVSGRPSAGFEEGGAIRFVPPASESFTAYVTVDKQLLLVDDTDTVTIPGLDNTIISWVTSYIFKSIQMNEEAQIHLMEYERSLREAMGSDARRPANELGSQGFPGRTPELITPPWLDPFNNGRTQ